jgi:hypothetical protein
MKLLALVLALFAVGAPSKTVRLTIIHTVRGCHVWQSSHDLGPAGTVTLARGGKLVLRVSCPMNFTLTQTRGPRVALGNPVVSTGTSRTILFPKRGVYVLRAVNVQSSADMGLQTLGPDNTLVLTVRVV